MTGRVLRALTLAALAALCAGAAVTYAGTANGGNAKGTRSKASSFAPQGHSHRHVYGAPIQPRIVSSPRHQKQHPRDSKQK